jgi:hypothetical protein
MGGISYFSDSDGKQHFIYKQSEEMSCALACLNAIDNCIHRSSNVGGEPRIKSVSAVYPGSLQQSQNENPGHAGAGSSMGNIEQTAAALGIRFTAKEESLALPIISSLAFDKARLYENRPALVAIFWREGFLHMSPAGGHAVIATRFTSSGRVVVLDPWDPSLVEIDAVNGRYGTNGYIRTVWYTG